MRCAEGEASGEEAEDTHICDRSQRSQRQWSRHDMNTFCPVLGELTELRSDLGLSQSFLLRKAVGLYALGF